METRVIDNRLAAIIQHHAATEPPVPSTQRTGAVGNPKPMDTENPSTGLGLTTTGRPTTLPQRVEEANRLAQSVQRAVSFAIDENSGRVVIRVTDETTGEVIRQIPSEEFLEMVARVQEEVGLFFDEIA